MNITTKNKENGIFSTLGIIFGFSNSASEKDEEENRKKLEEINKIESELGAKERIDKLENDAFTYNVSKSKSDDDSFSYTVGKRKNRTVKTSKINIIENTVDDSKINESKKKEENIKENEKILGD